MYDVLKWSGQGTLCCWLRVHIRRLQVMGSVCSIGLVALLPRGGRSRKRDAGRGAEVKPPVRGRPTRVTGQGSRECHAIMAIERVFRARHRPHQATAQIKAQNHRSIHNQIGQGSAACV